MMVQGDGQHRPPQAHLYSSAAVQEVACMHRLAVQCKADSCGLQLVQLFARTQHLALAPQADQEEGVPLQACSSPSFHAFRRGVQRPYPVHACHATRS